ncbi:MAG: diacylglycerol kinase family lipid kinase [Eubacteriales bacterium]|nr:diacylglycerol kinase family lipid kinase [Eubacteriales bacterium]
MYYIVYNPTAGAGRAVGRLAQLEQYLTQNHIDYHVAPSQYAGHTTVLVQEAIEQGHRQILTLGGDGTVLEATRGYIRAGAPDDVVFGFLPGGTGNDFTRALGMLRDPVSAFAQLHDGSTRLADVWRANDEYFVNVSGMGLDVEVIAASLRTKRWFKGQAAYISAIFLTLMRHRSQQMRVWLDGKLLERNVLVVTFSNGAYYGGGLHVCPPASPYDGQLDVVLVNHVSKWRIPFLLLKYRSGTHIGTIRECEYYRASHIRVETDAPQPFEFDGEAKEGTPLEIAASGYAVRVMVPRD